MVLVTCQHVAVTQGCVALRMKHIAELHIHAREAVDWRTYARGKSNPRALTRTNKGERCWLWEIYKPWPREPLASNPLVRLKKPPPLSPRRWCSWAQGAVGREVEVLSEGKHVHEPPPDMLPQKSKQRNRDSIETPSTGEPEGKRTEGPPQGVEVLVQEGRRKPSDGEREHGMIPQGCPIEAIASLVAIVRAIARSRPVHLGGTRDQAPWTSQRFSAHNRDKTRKLQPSQVSHAT
jgi:hypothetical protein